MIQIGSISNINVTLCARHPPARKTEPSQITLTLCYTDGETEALKREKTYAKSQSYRHDPGENGAEPLFSPLVILTRGLLRRAEGRDRL